MPVTSDASPFTSVTVSPMEFQDIDELPIELKVPLPSSSACSDEEGDVTVQTKGGPKDPPSISIGEEEDTHAKAAEVKQEHEDDVKAKSEPEELHEPAHISLDELARFVQLEAYQRRQTAAAQFRMDQLTLNCGLDRRMISTFSIAYGNMIDQYKTDDQAGFAMIYEACEQVKASCQMAAQATDPLGLYRDTDLRLTQEDVATRSCIQELPPESQQTILTFLTRLRTDPDFLSERISQLSASELLTLTSSYHPAGIDYSVLQNHSHGKTSLYSKDSQMMSLSRRMDSLQRFHDEDPFFALLYGVFDSSAKPGSEEDQRRMDIWSTTCAKNFTDASTGTRIGSDEFAIATLDAFANFQEWPLKPKMESYLMKILAEGSFLLDQPSHQPTNFKEPVEMHHATAAIREAEYFEKALIDLFALLTTQQTQQPQQAVPESALAFVHAVLRKIEDPELRLRAKRFIVCRWYFATFISSIVLHPEVRGIMMTHHVGETARLQVLQQLVLRLQQRVFDVVLQCNNQALINPEVRDGIMAIFQIFEPPNLLEEEPSLQIRGRDDEEATDFIMLSALDITGLIQTLYPDRKPNAEANEPGSAAAFSDRPSTAGSSTLIAGSSDFGSAEAPSTAPSSIEASDKPATDVSSAAETHIEEQDFAHPLKIDLKNPFAETAEVAKEDLVQRLQITCRKLKGLLAHAGSPTQPNAWTLLYYSPDGYTLTIGLEARTAGRQNPSDPYFNCHGWKDDPARDQWLLKAAVTRLLGKDSDHTSNALCPYQTTRRDDNPLDPLEGLMEGAASKARSNLDFRTAHFWWQTLARYRDFLNSAPTTSPQTLLQEISKDLRTSTEIAAKASKDCDIQCRSLVRLQHYQNSVLTQNEEQRKALRIKMWYLSDVRHSATYEEALLVTRALRTMASPKRIKQPGSLSNWARQRLRGSSIHDRSEAQTLEALTAPKEHGGLSKLADEQVDLTSRWLTRKSIENFCKGEERIHRFCYEIQRSVGKIAGPSLLESPVLWSSNLFRSERLSFSSQIRTRATGPPYGSTLATSSPLGYAPLNTTGLPSPGAPPKGLGLRTAKTPTSAYGGLWPVSQPPGASTGVTYHPILPPTPISPPTAWSSNVFTSGSPLHPFAPPLPSISGFGRHSANSSEEGESSPEKEAFTEQVKKNLCSLLLSDLGYLLWNQGSETDSWINDHIAMNTSMGRQGDSKASQGNTVPVPIQVLRSGETAEPSTALPRQGKFSKDIPTNTSEFPASQSHPTHSHDKPSHRFPFLEAYASLLWSFSLTHDPNVKLYALYELEDLIIKSLHDTSKSSSGNERRSRPDDVNLRSKSVPRTKATSLEEVIANCTERRAGTLRFQGSQRGTVVPAFASKASTEGVPGNDDIVIELLSIFRSTNLRPTTLFRDLQYIAAFVPSEILDQTPQGKAFWDVALAALALKDDLCDVMIIRANEVTAYHIPFAKPSDPSAETALASSTLRDAANLWLITAKEGSPVAARELGLFYLTHPKLLPRTTMPNSKAKDVFDSVVSMDYRTGDKERGALDPYAFAVVRHWMEIAANGGDKDARDFLRGSGDVGAGR